MAFRFLAALLLLASLAPAPAMAQGLILKYHMTMKMTPAQGSKIVPPAATSEDYTVTLFPKVLEVQGGDATRIYDFVNRRVYLIDTAGKTFSSFSLYSLPAFNRLEKQQREQTAVQKGASGEVKDVDIDMAFGSNSDTKTSDMIQTTFNQGGAAFSANGRALGDFSPSNAALPDDLKPTYAHFLTYETTMHPVLEHAVQDGGKVFDVLHYIVRTPDGETETSLKLTSTDKTSKEPAMTPGLSQSFTGNAGLDDAIRKSMTGTPPEARYFDASIKGFLDKKDSLRAALSVTEMELTLGKKSAEELEMAQTVARLRASNPLMNATLEAFAKIPQSTDDFVGIMTQLNSAKEAAPDFAYLIEMFRADKIRSVLEGKRDLRPEEADAMHQALDKLVGAVTVNPRLVGAYCDLATFYFHQGETRTAWILWEQAERLNPAYPALQPVRDMQSKIARDFPEYF